MTAESSRALGFVTPARMPPELLEAAVLEVRDYAIIGLDATGTIISWNLGAELLKGYSASEALGRSFAMFYRDEDRVGGLPRDLLESARREGRVQHSGWRVRKDGSEFWADVVITARHDDAGQVIGFIKVTRDLSEQHRLEEALRASEARVRLLVGQVVDYAIILLDPEGVIETWNLGAERVKGYTAEEAIGHSFAMFYTPQAQAEGLPQQLLAQARARGRVQSTGWRVRKDGTRFWADVVITALHDGEGRLTGFSKVTRDRSEIKALEDAQDSFYAAFNHDFRTPITALLGFVDALRDSEADTREYLIDRIEANAQRLLGMVETLVGFARTRSADLALNLGAIDLTEVARGAVKSLPTPLGPHRVHVVDQPAMAKANGVAMHRVVSNLLVNALKYSSPDSIVRVEVGAAERDRVWLRVVDRGRGIDPADLDAVFEEFQRGRLAEDDGGTGLGLSSVRDLVHQQGGEVSIDSRPGEGTTVSVTLDSAMPGWSLGVLSRTTGQSPGDSDQASDSGHDGG